MNTKENLLKLYGTIKDIEKRVIEYNGTTYNETVLAIEWQGYKKEETTAVYFYKDLPEYIVVGASVKVCATVISLRGARGWFTKANGFSIDMLKQDEK